MIAPQKRSLPSASQVVMKGMPQAVVLLGVARKVAEINENLYPSQEDGLRLLGHGYVTLLYKKSFTLCPTECSMLKAWRW